METNNQEEKEKQLIENLADLEHAQWSHWTKYMLDNLTEKNIQRWKKQIETPHSELSEKEKESDMEWARKVLKILHPDEEKIKISDELKQKILELETNEEELGILKELKKGSSENSITRGILFFQCFNFLKNYKVLESGELNVLLENNKPSEELQVMIEEYLQDDYGKHYIGENIKREVMKDNKKISDFIEAFFAVFQEEE